MGVLETVEKTFGPMTTMNMAMGVSPSDMYAGWRKRVMEDTTDWGLCPDCARIFVRSTGINTQPFLATSEKKWWQFWK